VPIYAERIVRRAHALDIRVAVWTVNDQPTMHGLLDAGVDAIITDHPDLLREVLIARGQWSPLAGRRTATRLSPSAQRP
jgi:glycerophosphoryl diester phosphodiesterase